MSATRFLPLLALLAAFALGAPLHADEEPDPLPQGPGADGPAKTQPKKLAKVMRPFLWRVEGETPSFLFGTAHVTDPRVIAMHPLSKEAFEKAEVAGFEVDMIRDAAAQLEAMRLPEGEVFEEIVPAKLLARLDARLTKIHPMASRQMLAASGIENLRPAAWAVLLGSLEEQLKNLGKPMLDSKLQMEARQGGKEVVGMEKPEEQAALFSALTNEEQVKLLSVSLDAYDEADKAGEDLTSKMVEIYLAGDEGALLKMAKEMMPEGKLSKELLDKIWAELSFKRNARIAKKLIELRKANPKKRYFVAVGVMHLAGEKNVQHYLKQAGLTTTRVTDSLAPAKAPEPAGAK